MELLTRWLANALDATEREVVLGDLKESRLSAWATSAQVLGLVMRRQAECWKDWRPWVAAVSLFPVVWILAVSGGMAAVVAVQPYPDPWRHLLNIVGAILAFMYCWLTGHALARLAGKAWWSTLCALGLAAIAPAIFYDRVAFQEFDVWSLSAGKAICFFVPLLLGALTARTVGWRSVVVVLAALVFGYQSSGISYMDVHGPVQMMLVNGPVLYFAWDAFRDGRATDVDTMVG